MDRSKQRLIVDLLQIPALPLNLVLRSWVRHRHHLVSDSIGFHLIGIPWLTDGELSLDSQIRLRSP